MSSIEYDPDEKPYVNFETNEYARSIGLIPITVVCDEPGAQVGDQTGVSFALYVYAGAVPHVGDRITLQDKTECMVKSVRHNVFAVPGTSIISAGVNVYAVRMGADTGESA